MTFQSKSALIAAAALSLAAGANAAVSFNGDANMEFDTTNLDGGRGINQGGRVEINLAGKSTNGDSFVAGRTSVIAGKSGAASIDDMWVQFGNSKADLKLGRFEAADLAPQGRDTIVNRAGTGAYTANNLRGREGTAIAAAAATINVGAGASVEIGLVETKAAANFGGSGGMPGTNNAAKGIRPVLTFGAGPATVRLGFESGKLNDAGTFRSFSGFGATAGMKAGPGALNVNFASGKAKALTTFGDTKGTTISANYTVDLGPWVFLESASIDPAVGATQKVTTFALGYQLSLFGVKDAFITPALSSSKATDPLGGLKKDNGVRVRVNYNFAAF